MVTMARPRKQTYTMNMYLEKMKENDICNDADVQRNFVWSNEQINELIVTVLTDDYIPPIILGEEENSQLHIADGGQRSAALNKFRNGNYKITSAIENSIIPYKKKVKADHGRYLWEDATFDIKNKTYEKLPDELKKKFDEYQIETVIHENCDRYKISKYIKRYNNHVSMNTNQKAFTYLYNFAGYVREILDSRFFLDYSSYTETEKTKGMVERVIVETIMCTYYIDNWKKQTKDICKFLNKNASNLEFEKLADNLHRLENIITDDIKDIFNSKDSFIFLTLFHKYTKLNIDDHKFADFLYEFKYHLRTVKINEKGMLFDEIDKDKGTKDKAVILAKLDMLEKMMVEFFHIDQIGTGTYNMDQIETFISEIVTVDQKVLHENMDLYVDMLEGDYGLKRNCIKDGSKLLDAQNSLSLLAMVAYAEKTGQNLDDWLKEYSEKNNTYFMDQKKNFLYMLHDFKEFIVNKKITKRKFDYL